MHYPQYPLPENNITPKGHYPKDDFLQVMRTWDELTALGLDVLPKQADKKLPVFRFWRKKKTEGVTRKKAYNEQKKDNVSGWCIRCGVASNRLVVVDLDTAELIRNGHNPDHLYERIQSMSECAFVLHTPANGVHLYYRVPEHLEMLDNSAPAIKGLDIRGEGGQVVSLHGYNRYDNTKDSMYAHDKGVVDGHTASYRKIEYGKYDSIPEMSEELYEFIRKDKHEPRPKTTEQIRGENYARTELGSDRIQRHFSQASDDRERVVLECLEIVLSRWHDNKSYDEWVQMWMSAHHGSDGSANVRDFILEAETIYWSNGTTGKRHFRNAWDAHEYKDDGFTVASLFYLARKEGWLATTGYEISDKLSESINVRYISEWLDTQLDIPRRVLIKSQTGSGKTYAMANLWNRLGQPRSVVFVPTTKLATELAYTLNKEHGIPATLYMNDADQTIKEANTMIKAEFLVTTLQTFATKVFPHVEMRQYGLVYVEESDQLLSQFSRGGGGIYSTHVSEHEARAGFKVIRDAMENSGCVWFVDATMTKATYYVAEALRRGRELRTIHNEYVIDKPDVEFFNSKGAIYQQVLVALEKGLKVVLTSDTKATAYEVYETMGKLGHNDSILITADTKHRTDVKEFMRDVNEGAKQYQLVCYSPVMASGVSITEIRPDLVAQVSTWLTPRNNLQMLNRYRKQDRVICYYSNSEQLYNKNAQELIEEARVRAKLESLHVQIPLAIRNDDAQLRSHIASTSVGDEQLQMRAPKELYMRLLQGDGRRVTFSGNEIESTVLKHTRKAVSEAKKEMVEEIAETWRQVPPIDRDNPPSPDMDALDVARGEVHAYIDRCLLGNIPDDVDDREIYDIVKEFGKYAYPLDSFISQNNTLTKAESYLADDGKAIMALSNNITMVKVVSLVRFLYESLDDKLRYDTIEDRTNVFLSRLRDMRQEYDNVIHRATQKYEAVLERGDDDVATALSFAKILLKKIGLKQRAIRASQVGGVTRYDYHVANNENALKFLKWRNNGEDFIDFTDEDIKVAIEERKDENELFRELDEKEQDRVMKLMQRNSTTFKKAVRIVHGGEQTDDW